MGTGGVLGLGSKGRFSRKGLWSLGDFHFQYFKKGPSLEKNPKGYGLFLSFHLKGSQSLREKPLRNFGFLLPKFKLDSNFPKRPLLGPVLLSFYLEGPPIKGKTLWGFWAFLPKLQIGPNLEKFFKIAG